VLLTPEHRDSSLAPDAPGSEQSPVVLHSALQFRSSQSFPIASSSSPPYLHHQFNGGNRALLSASSTSTAASVSPRGVVTPLVLQQSYECGTGGDLHASWPLGAFGISSSPRKALAVVLCSPRDATSNLAVVPDATAPSSLPLSPYPFAATGQQQQQYCFTLSPMPPPQLLRSPRGAIGAYVPAGTPMFDDASNSGGSSGLYAHYAVHPTLVDESLAPMSNLAGVEPPWFADISWGQQCNSDNPSW